LIQANESRAIVPTLSLHSPVGDLTVFEDDGAIVAIDWGWVPDQDDTPLLRRARRWLDDYFDGETNLPDLPLRPAGTPHQHRVWTAMRRIPYGATMTYGALAKEAGSNPRATGTACGANPIPIIIPCHRVLAANDGLGGYSGQGGVDTKVALLRLERVLL
jgi:methylated-DNA-[protein]-cysteine S-methyltransferase